MSQNLNSPVILKGVILLIFEKALDEPKYSSMYSQLCKRLSKEAPNFEESDKPCTFLRLLLNVCRDKFENRSEYSEKIYNSESLSEDEEKKHVAKQKILGNVKFIGELFKLDMLDDCHLHKMLQQLLDKKSRPNASLEGRCEDMECLSQLIRTCGKHLDTEKGKVLIDQYFERMEQESNSMKYPPRIRFLLRDIIELRRDNWIPRKMARIEGPVPIQELSTDEDIIWQQRDYRNRNSEHRNQEADSNSWMNRLPYNYQTNMNFGSLTMSNASTLIPP